jgi:GxxExxY protein
MMRNEPGTQYDDAARAVIGAAIEVHKHLGPGYLESVYQKAMEIELLSRNIPFVGQKKIEVSYKGHPVGRGQFDLFVEGVLVVELKAVETVAPIHMAQVISYLKTLNRPLGLLINFKVLLLKSGVKRVILSAPNHQDAHQQLGTEPPRTLDELGASEPTT